VNRFLISLAIIVAVFIPSAGLADDWVAVKLRGHVLQLVANQWEPLERGDIVSDDRVIRTLRDGRVEFQRDKETISLAADTQIQIRDRSGQKYTTVKQHFGQVEVEAEVRNVQHFAIDTPYLAAVVKGTRFVVTSGEDGASVKVKRGLVSVGAAGTDAHADIPAGQTANVRPNGAFSISGFGSRKTVVLGADGLPFAADVTVPPGQDPDFTPPGQDPDFTPPGQDPDFTPPGQDPDFTPPGQDPDFTPPGRDKDKDKDKDEDED
jgi:hypothetical protein